MFKELLTIKYKNKKFLVLSDSNHRKTFLEVDENGKYIYPDVNDFIELDRIYNHENPFLFSSRKLSYEEKVRVGMSIALASLYIGAVGSGIAIAKYVPKEVYGRISAHEMDEHFGRKSVTREDILEAIDNNQNLSEYYKDMARQTLDKLMEVDPKGDFRIFWKHMQDLTIEELSHEDLEEATGQKIDGDYDASTNHTRLANNNLYTFEHEIGGHGDVIYFYEDPETEEVVYVYDIGPIFVSEAYADYIAKYSSEFDIRQHGNRIGNYGIGDKITEFFEINVKNYDYRTYRKHGGHLLIDLIRQRYPSVDIDFLVDVFEGNRISELHGLGKINLAERFDVLDELFKIASSNIDKDNIMGSFEAFMYLVDNDSNVYSHYQPQYVDTLLRKDLITYDQHKLLKAHYLYLSPEGVYLSYDNGTYIDHDGGIKETKDGRIIKILGRTKQALIDNRIMKDEIDYVTSQLPMDLVIYYVETGNLYETHHVFISEFNKCDLETKRTIYDELFERLVVRKSNGTYDELRDGYRDFSNHLSAYESEELLTRYQSLYEGLLLRHCNEEDLGLASSITSIIEFNDRFYPVINISNETEEELIWSNGYISAYGVDGDIIFVYIDEDKKTRVITLSGENLFRYRLNQKNELVRYMIYNQNGNPFTSEYLEGFITENEKQYQESHAEEQQRTINNG